MGKVRKRNHFKGNGEGHQMVLALKGVNTILRPCSRHQEARKRPLCVQCDVGTRGRGSPGD